MFHRSSLYLIIRIDVVMHEIPTTLTSKNLVSALHLFLFSEVGAANTVHCLSNRQEVTISCLLFLAGWENQEAVLIHSELE
jgi:hypothetical protein